jgi:hypothetical protein
MAEPYSTLAHSAMRLAQRTLTSFPMGGSVVVYRIWEFFLFEGNWGTEERQHPDNI